jgi:hypothetical protein
MNPKGTSHDRQKLSLVLRACKLGLRLRHQSYKPEAQAREKTLTAKVTL